MTKLTFFGEPGETRSMLKTLALFVFALGVGHATTVYGDDLFYLASNGTLSNHNNVTSLSGAFINSSSGWVIDLTLTTNLTGPFPNATYTSPLEYSASFTAECEMSFCSPYTLLFGATFTTVSLTGSSPYPWDFSLAGTGPSGNTTVSYSLTDVGSRMETINGPSYSFSDSGTISSGSPVNLAMNVSFALPFGSYGTNITIPAGKTIDYVVGATPTPEPAFGFAVGLSLAGIAAWRIRRARR